MARENVHPRKNRVFDAAQQKQQKRKRLFRRKPLLLSNRFLACQEALSRVGRKSLPISSPAFLTAREARCSTAA